MFVNAEDKAAAKIQYCQVPGRADTACWYIVPKASFTGDLDHCPPGCLNFETRISKLYVVKDEVYSENWNLSPKIGSKDSPQERYAPVDRRAGKALA